MKISERLRLRLEKHFGKRVTELERLYPHCTHRWAGAWSWAARLEDGSDIGSVWNMTECVQRDKWEHYTATDGTTEVRPFNEAAHD